MTGYVLALSGAIGAGKTELGNALAAALQADHVSFGEAVRGYAKEKGRPSNDRSVLQELGQALVLTQCGEFVDRVLRQSPRQVGADGKDLKLVVQGLRHVEVLRELKERIHGRPVYLVHIETPSATREARVMKRDNVERRLVARYDNDITEAQVERILPQYARFKVNGDLPTDLQVDSVSSWLKELVAPTLTTAA